MLAVRFFPAKVVYLRMTPERLFVCSCPHTLNRVPSSFKAPSSGWEKCSTPVLLSLLLDSCLVIPRG